MKTLTNSKNCVEISVLVFLGSHWSILSSVQYIHGQLSEQFSGSHSAFGTTFRVTGGYRKAGRSFISQLVSDFIVLYFLHKKLPIL
jgi:hypothetical protein